MERFQEGALEEDPGRNGAVTFVIIIIIIIIIIIYIHIHIIIIIIIINIHTHIHTYLLTCRSTLFSSFFVLAPGILFVLALLQALALLLGLPGAALPLGLLGFWTLFCNVHLQELLVLQLRLQERPNSLRKHPGNTADML